MLRPRSAAPSGRAPERVADALYEPDGERFRPTELTRGPWDPRAQHGGPPAALLAFCVEWFAGDDGMQTARMTVELLRPVPLDLLAVSVRRIRPGKKVQLLEATLRAGEVDVARGTTLRMRARDLPVPAEVEAPAPPRGPDEGTTSVPPWSDAIWRPAFHSDAVEHRFTAGGFDRPGPATDWIRLRVPVVAGSPAPPVARVMAAADFGNGVSWVLSRNDGWAFINPDLTVYLHRLPAGEWVCLEATTLVGPRGIGLAESRLWDERGVIGRSVQSLLLDRR